MDHAKVADELEKFLGAKSPGPRGKVLRERIAVGFVVLVQLLILAPFALFGHGLGAVLSTLLAVVSSIATVLVQAILGNGFAVFRPWEFITEDAADVWVRKAQRRSLKGNRDGATTGFRLVGSPGRVIHSLFWSGCANYWQILIRFSPELSGNLGGSSLLIRRDSVRHLEAFMDTFLLVEGTFKVFTRDGRIMATINRDFAMVEVGSLVASNWAARVGTFQMQVERLKGKEIPNSTALPGTSGAILAQPGDSPSEPLLPGFGPGEL
jgi:hypothetical protein